MQEPSFHKNFQINQRVSCCICPETDIRITGTIIGIASMHVIFNYVILLDESLTLLGYEGWRGLSIPGTELKELT